MGFKVAINGFGRIGRNFLRCSWKKAQFDIVAINDITSAKTLAHLLKYDTVFGRFESEVKATDNAIIVDGKEIVVSAEKNPEVLPWSKMGVDLVLESTGLFTKRDDAAKHLKAGARKVIISAPATDPDLTVVMGVNDNQYKHDKHHILSNASCTTNCIAPVCKVLHEKLGIIRGNMTTIHSYTNDQRILDLPHKDLRRARAAAQNIIPTSTGASKAVGLVIPDLKGKLAGCAIRVPTTDVSITDIVVNVKKSTTVDELKGMFKNAAENELKGILEYCEEPLVSSDFIGNEHSSIVDADYITVIEGDMIKLLAWYDNEWGYSCRVRDLIAKIVKLSR